MKRVISSTECMRPPRESTLASLCCRASDAVSSLQASAALAWSEETAELGRLHNNANVVAVGARMHTVDEATRFVEVFVSTDFTGEERHVRRISMLTDYEDTGVLPEAPAADLGPSGGAV